MQTPLATALRSVSPASWALFSAEDSSNELLPSFAFCTASSQRAARQFVVSFVLFVRLYPMCANLVPIKYIPSICQMSNVFRESSDFCASSYTFANRSAFMITSTEDSQRDFGSKAQRIQNYVIPRCKGVKPASSYTTVAV
jgi:hypothetical protein